MSNMGIISGIIDATSTGVQELNGRRHFLKRYKIRKGRWRRRNVSIRKARNEKYRILFNNTPLPMWVLDRNTYRFIDVNQAAISYYGFSKDEFKAMTPLDLSDNTDTELFLKKAKRVCWKVKNYGISSHRKKDGTVVKVEVYGHLIWHEGQTAILGQGIDVTDRLQYEKELESKMIKLECLSAHLLKVREEERIKIAREMHDELGQRLTVLKMDLDWLGSNSETYTGLWKQKLSNMDLLIKETVQALRNISSELRPGLLDNLGLIAAIEWHIRELGVRSAIKIHFQHNLHNDGPPEPIKTTVYRIVQESLTNIVKHAKSSEVNIQLMKKGSEVLLTIMDDGIGFDLSMLTTGKTFGVIGMQERAKMINGVFNITSAKGKGTSVHVRVPFAY